MGILQINRIDKEAGATFFPNIITSSPFISRTRFRESDFFPFPSVSEWISVPKKDTAARTRESNAARNARCPPRHIPKINATQTIDYQ